LISDRRDPQILKRPEPFSEDSSANCCSASGQKTAGGLCNPVRSSISERNLQCPLQAGMALDGVNATRRRKVRRRRAAPFERKSWAPCWSDSNCNEFRFQNSEQDHRFGTCGAGPVAAARTIARPRDWSRARYPGSRMSAPSRARHWAARGRCRETWGDAKLAGGHWTPSNSRGNR